MSKESYEDAFNFFAHAHHGTGRWRSWDNNDKTMLIHNEPLHITNENGLSLLSGKGYGAIVTRAFFENVNRDTADFASKLLPALSDKNGFLVCLAIISMSDISFSELMEKLGFDENTLRASLDSLIETGIVVEKKSKHKSLGFTYDIHEMYHTCLCILIATLEMQRYSFRGVSCCMGFGDFPIQL